MRTSERGLNLIKKYEGLKLQAYICPAGIWTIGYGHTPSRRGQVITVEEANRLLVEDAGKAEKAVLRCVKVKLTQGQFDALVSFTFNLGEGNLRSSTLLQKLNAGDYAGAASQFERWVYAKVSGKSVRLPGLIKRRDDERRLFLS